MTDTGGWCWWSGRLPGSLWAPERARQCTTVLYSSVPLLCLESMLESEQDETLPEALRTQALTALTHNFVSCLCKQLNFLFLICSNETVTEKGFEAWDLLLGRGDLI